MKYIINNSIQSLNSYFLRPTSLRRTGTVDKERIDSVGFLNMGIIIETEPECHSAGLHLIRTLEHIL